jgi:hypothetical protein
LGLHFLRDGANLAFLEHGSKILSFNIRFC